MPLLASIVQRRPAFTEELAMRQVVDFRPVTLLLAWVSLIPQAQAATPCERLSQLALPNTKIVSARTVAAGAFAPPPSLSPWMAGDPAAYKALPAFCRVVAQATPSADSDINIEVWMPVSGWNGRFRAQGNGGFAGEIDYRSLGDAAGRGYATAATDTGHAGSGLDARWALGHPEKVIDFGYRAIHEMTQVAKAAIQAFYGKGPAHSYFASCSNGGRQALMEAQRFPQDYDGILAGAPANFWTHLLTSAVWDAQATTLDDASYIPAGKLPAIARAVNDACDAKDGVADGILDDPRRCRFDPAAMLCKDGDAATCLTAPQVSALKKLYEGARDSNGRTIFPGFLPGAEEGEGGWGPWITGSAPGKGLLFTFGTGFFSDMVYDKADWDYKTANLDQAVKAADDRTARTLNATDPDLKPFKGRGGRLILYHGWNDPAISALNTIDYYESVVKTMPPGEVEPFLRLYMAPGVQHCGDGPGATSFGQAGATRAADPQHSLQLALEKWVERGTAPSTIIATRYAETSPSAAAAEVKMTRPLCPYPQTAAYRGTGDTNDAASFTCVAR
jgi:feruloyl esterase